MTLNAALRKTRSEARVGFVLVELDLAATFCERALSTENKETQERNIRNAEKAHHAALYFIQGLCLKKAEQALVEERVLRLKGVFERLDPNGRR